MPDFCFYKKRHNNISFDLLYNAIKTVLLKKTTTIRSYFAVCLEKEILIFQKTLEKNRIMMYNNLIEGIQKGDIEC